MSTAEPLPPIDLTDAPPLSDADLDAYLSWAEDHPWHEDPSDVDPLAEVAEAPDAYRDDLVAALPVYRWTIGSLADAEWAMARLAEAQGHLDVLNAQRTEWMRAAQDRIERWYARASRRSTHTVNVMAAKLERYALDQRAADPKVKSVPLPSGVVRTTESQPSAKVLDEAQAAIYVQSNIEVELGMPADDPDLPTPWADAYRASGITSLDALVRWDPKVYVAPLRKIVTVAEVPTGAETVVLDLSCGHDVSERFDATADAKAAESMAAALGGLTECPSCEPDPIEGPLMQHIVAVQRIPEMEWRVVGPDGEPVPGTTVDLGGVTAKAVPGA